MANRKRQAGLIKEDPVENLSTTIDDEILSRIFDMSTSMQDSFNFKERKVYRKKYQSGLITTLNAHDKPFII